MKRLGARSEIAAFALAAIAFALAGCPDESPPAPATDAGTDAPALAPEWRPVLEGLDGALLSIWGTSSKDVWAVGGALGNGFDSLVVRFDGKSWRRAKPGGTSTYWWVHGSSATDVWLVGEGGRITRWNGAAFEEVASGTTATLYGVLALSANDAWAVGGTPEQPDQPNDVVLHWDGSSWRPEVLPAPTKSALFKVWGTSSDDLWVVGEAGVVWHRAAGGWTREATGVARGRLTTITGCSSSELYAVGGRELLTSDGKTWSRSDALLVNDVNGVACAPPGARAREWGDVVVVGGGSLKLRRVAGQWVDDFGSKPFADLHGAWIDETGALWGVGGSFTASAKAGARRDGVVARYSDDLVPQALEP